MELKFESDEGGRVPSGDELRSVLVDFPIGTIAIQSADENSFILRFEEITEETHIAMLEKLEGLEGVSATEERFDSIGPTIGAETARKSLQAIGLVIVMIVGYVAWAFRGIKYPLNSFKWGLVALVALFHDILITIGVFAVFAHFSGQEVGVPFIAALLTILGYSVNDTIVVFDRIRENLLRFGKEMDFAQLADKSVRETIVRSLNVSLTTLFVLTAVLFLGGATIQGFVFALIVGISVGTYSSLALASPMLVSWANRKS